MRQLVIIGAGGHGVVCAEIAKLCGYDRIVFLDDKESSTAPISGPVDSYTKYLEDSDFFVAIGDNQTRRVLLERLENSKADIISLVHPSAVISDTAVIGKGSVVMAGAVINARTRISNGVIINTCSSVDHDCKIKDYAHISVGAHIAGVVNVGDEVFVGAGATVINMVTVCSGCIIGAGGVVICDLLEKGTYVGVPVKKIACKSE